MLYCDPLLYKSVSVKDTKLNIIYIPLVSYTHYIIESDDPWYSKLRDAEESVKSKWIQGLMDCLNDMKCFISQTKKHSAMGQSTSSSNRVPLIATPPGSSSLTSSRSKPTERLSDSESSHMREKRKTCGKITSTTKVTIQHKKSKLKYKKKKQKEREKDAHLETLQKQRRKKKQSEGYF